MLTICVVVVATNWYQTSSSSPVAAQEFVCAEAVAQETEPGTVEVQVVVALGIITVAFAHSSFTGNELLYNRVVELPVKPLAVHVVTLI
jgi:hypothetical protein